MPRSGRLGFWTSLCALLPLLPVLARLLYLQVLRHEPLSSRVEAETQRQELEIVPRGRILDRQGRELALSVPTQSAYLDLKESRDLERQIRVLAKALGLKASELSRRCQERRRFVWVLRHLDPERASRLRALKLPSLGFVSEQQRAYPNGELARSLLGALDAQGRGVSGLERTFESRLRGAVHRVRLSRDAAGRPIAEEGPKDRPAPPDLVLTLERSVQFFAEEELRQAVERERAKSGAVLIQDPESGDILAMALYPSDPMRNAAVQDVYEPGSTFKIVAMLGTLERRLLGPAERLDCENGRWRLAEGVFIKDHEKEGALTLSEILERSSNIGTAKLGLRLGAETFHRYCRLFGFGYKTGVPVPAESPGLLEPASRLSAVRLANGAFGQGLAVTPLQLVGAYSALANGGVLMEPRLVLGLSGEPPTRPAPVRRLAAPESVSGLRRMLEGVVLRGTGVSARVPGYRLAGKTGTAQKIDPKTGRYSPTDYVSSFAGYAPADKPRFAILVILDTPRGRYYGSEVAAPVFARLCRRLFAFYGIPPDPDDPAPPGTARGSRAAAPGKTPA